MPPVSDTSKPVVMQAEDMKVWFPIKAGFLRKVVDHVKAVDGIDLTLRAGQTLGVVGESGSGKTTLGLALTRLISSKGRISFIGNDIAGYSFKQMRPLRNRTADRLPGSFRLAQPPHGRQRHHRRGAESA